MRIFSCYFDSAFKEHLEIVSVSKSMRSIFSNTASYNKTSCFHPSSEKLRSSSVLVSLLFLGTWQQSSPVCS